MKKPLTIKSVMHAFPHTIGPQMTLKVALETFREHNIRHLPVKEANKLVGILTERDVDFALRVEKREPEQMTVREAYTAEPFITDLDTPVAEVAARMAHDHLGCALVVDGGRLVGIFTTVDACRALAEQLTHRAEQ